MNAEEYREAGRRAVGILTRPDGRREFFGPIIEQRSSDALRRAKELVAKEKFSHEDSARTDALLRVAQLEAELYGPGRTAEDAYSGAFRAYLTRGINNLDTEQRAILEK